MSATAREWQRLGLAAVLGAIVAFPAGIVFSGRESVPPEAPDSKAANAPAAHKTEGRSVYSPIVLRDPYVLRKHQEIVEALELSCRQTGKACAEAKQARQYLLGRE